jgi:hypothetical protein
MKEKSRPNHIGKIGEKHLQKELGGKLTPGSRVGDLQVDDILVEKKSTEKRSISLKQDYLEKIDRIAFENRRTPALVIEFETTKQKYCSTQWAVIPLEFFKELLDLRKN